MRAACVVQSSLCAALQLVTEREGGAKRAGWRKRAEDRFVGGIRTAVTLFLENEAHCVCLGLSTAFYGGRERPAGSLVRRTCKTALLDRRSQSCSHSSESARQRNRCCHAIYATLTPASFAPSRAPLRQMCAAHSPSATPSWSRTPSVRSAPSAAAGTRSDADGGGAVACNKVRNAGKVRVAGKRFVGEIWRRVNKAVGKGRASRR